MIGLHTCVDEEDCLEKLKGRTEHLHNVSRVYSRAYNFNAGKEGGVYLDHHSGYPMQVDVVNKDFIGKLSLLIMTAKIGVESSIS